MQTVLRFRLRALLFILVWFAGWEARAEDVLLPCVADTTLFESSQDYNMGGWTHVASGTTGNAGDVTRNRGLFRFDLGSIPLGAIITNAWLTLDVTGVPGKYLGGSSANSVFGLHRVLAPWGEGDKLGDRGDLASTNEATWNARFWPSQTWSAPGGAAPDDFELSPSATALIAGTNRYTFGPTTNLVADLQSWQANPAQNFGWILISQSETMPKTARRFGSREDGSHAPRLWIQYTPEIRLVNPRIDQGQFTFEFAAQPGVNYVLESKSDWTEPWVQVQTIKSSPEPANIVVRDGPLFSRRFYRLLRP